MIAIVSWMLSALWLCATVYWFAVTARVVWRGQLVSTAQLGAIGLFGHAALGGLAGMLGLFAFSFPLEQLVRFCTLHFYANVAMCGLYAACPFLAQWRWERDSD